MGRKRGRREHSGHQHSGRNGARRAGTGSLLTREAGPDASGASPEPGTEPEVAVEVGVGTGTQLRAEPERQLARREAERPATLLDLVAQFLDLSGASATPEERYNTIMRLVWLAGVALIFSGLALLAWVVFAVTLWLVARETHSTWAVVGLSSSILGAVVGIFRGARRRPPRH